MYYEFWQYYGTAIGFAALAGMARTIRNGQYAGVAHTASVGVLAGLIGFSAAAVYVGNDYSSWNPVGLAVASLTGSLSREVTDLFVKHILGKLLSVDVSKELDERSHPMDSHDAARSDDVEE